VSSSEPHPSLLKQRGFLRQAVVPGFTSGSSCSMLHPPSTPRWFPRLGEHPSYLKGWSTCFVHTPDGSSTCIFLDFWPQILHFSSSRPQSFIPAQDSKWTTSGLFSLPMKLDKQVYGSQLYPVGRFPHHPLTCQVNDRSCQGNGVAAVRFQSLTTDPSFSPSITGSPSPIPWTHTVSCSATEVNVPQG
jgi:hypothetical protein